MRSIQHRMPPVHVAVSGAIHRRMTASSIGRMLIFIGLSMALFAMALDRWTDLSRLELVSGCAGLITSAVAAMLSTSDLP
ncbi:MAG TPA: hypothetical protein VHE11_11585 [Steroidobacteraceae bacterium]|nr:hypothetical protein [Steroidobacteraceae bacterium]